MSSQRTVLVWCDLETTGLDENNGRILEYAVVCTDLYLNDILYMSKIIPQNVGIARTMMDEYVVKMHTENGLLEELENVEGERDCIQYVDSLERAEDEILQMLDSVKSVVGDHEVEVILVIAGSTIGFDKRWIKVHMPNLFEALHYRQLDVSSYKVGFSDIFGRETSAAHRAMDDIRVSIEQHRKMRSIVARGLQAEADDKLTQSIAEH